jgi:two-component system nitrogen regulation response regulator NtrX
MTILSDTGRLGPEDLPFAPRSAPVPEHPVFLDARTYEEFRERSERAYLEHQLARHGWNVAKTAKTLEMPRSNLYKKLEKHGLSRGEEAEP